MNIIEEMYFLFGSVDEMIEKIDNDLDFINKLVLIHQNFTRIHPFEDGNGRISRLLNNWLCKVKGYPYIIIELKNRIQYLEALKSADKGVYTDLNDIFVESMFESYNEYFEMFD